ncbi:MAG: hypothetical protein ACLP3C_25335 [Mycobacterium sp.]
MSTGCPVFGPGAITGFALAAIPQQYNPKAPQVLVRSTLANARTST